MWNEKVEKKLKKIANNEMLQERIDNKRKKANNVQKGKKEKIPSRYWKLILKKGLKINDVHITF
jgi:hypothetical protein